METSSEEVKVLKSEETSPRLKQPTGSPTAVPSSSAPKPKKKRNRLTWAERFALDNQATIAQLKSTSFKKRRECRDSDSTPSKSSTKPFNPPKPIKPKKLAPLRLKQKQISATVPEPSPCTTPTIITSTPPVTSIPQVAPLPEPTPNVIPNVSVPQISPPNPNVIISPPIVAPVQFLLDGTISAEEGYQAQVVVPRTRKRARSFEVEERSDITIKIQQRKTRTQKNVPLHKKRKIRRHIPQNKSKNPTKPRSMNTKANNPFCWSVEESMQRIQNNRGETRVSPDREFKAVVMNALTLD